MGRILEFNTRGNEKQAQAYKYWLNTDPSSQILYGGAKGGGKSYLGCSLIFGNALIYPETHYFIARKELTDLRKFTIPSIYEVLTNWEIDHDQIKYNGQDNYFELPNGSKVFLIQCKYLPADPMFERFGSIQMTQGWIEEGGQIHEAAYENLYLTIGRWKNTEYGIKKKLLITCNPSKNWMYREFYKPWTDGKLEKDKRFIQALPTDNKMLSEDYINSLRAIKDEATRQRLLEGNWEYDSDPSALILYDEIMDCFTNTHVQGGLKCMTADIALEGSDRLVIGVWDGWRLIDIAVMEKSAPDEVVKAIETLKVRHSIPNSKIVYDSDGVGAYVGGFVKGAKPFINNSRPIEVKGIAENYENLKAQVYYRMSDMINSGLVYLNVPDKHKTLIIEELEQVKSRDADKDGKLKLIKKEEVKKLIGRSPDFSDMIAMRVYFDLNKPKKRPRLRAGVA